MSSILSNSLLCRFASATHEQRLTMCNAFVRSTNEYYFERSAAVAQAILDFYTSGACVQ